MFSRKASYTSNAPSVSDRSSVDVDRTASALQSVHVSNSGRRTMSLEEDDEEETEIANRWNLIRATSGPMSSVSENGSQPDFPDTSAEVKTLCVTNLSRGCTSKEIYAAFDMKKDDMTIEIRSSDTALLHFPDSEKAMKAYFTYLSSTNSIGTVNPYEPGVSDSFSASPAKHPQLRNRRSFQNSNSNVLSALTNISSWRSSDKLSTGKDLLNDRELRPGHRTNSSRSSIHSKSAERLPSLATVSTTSTPLASVGTSPAADQRSFSDADSTHSRLNPPLSLDGTSVRLAPAGHEKRPKAASAARRIISAAGLSLKLPKREKSEKETKAQPAQKQRA